jgi:hypothetical protein
LVESGSVRQCTHVNIKVMSITFFSSLVALALVATTAYAAPKEEVLYELELDMDKNGTLDHAYLVLVGQGRADFSELTKETYAVSDGEHVDLFVYLNNADEVDISQEPELRIKAVATFDALRFAFPLQSNGKGSLNVVTSNGFGNTFNTTETLTIVHRNNEFWVGGWALDFYNSRDDQSLHCSINYLAGKAVRRDNNGKDVELQGNFKPIATTQWMASERPNICDE